jgi:replicative DNA helicase
MKSGSGLKRVWAGEARIPALKMRRPWLMTSDEKQRLRHVALEVVSEWPIFINDLSVQTPESFTAQARLAVLKHKLDLVMVDHIQIMTGKAKDEVQRIMDISKALRQFAKDYCPVVALSQFSRPPKTAAVQRPTMRDLKGSSALEQDASVIALIWRPAEKGVETKKDEIIVPKNRDGEAPKTIPVMYINQFLRFVGRAGEGLGS